MLLHTLAASAGWVCAMPSVTGAHRMACQQPALPFPHAPSWPSAVVRLCCIVAARRREHTACGRLPATA